MTTTHILAKRNLVILIPCGIEEQTCLQAESQLLIFNDENLLLAFCTATITKNIGAFTSRRDEECPYNQKTYQSREEV